ncbi:ATP-binding protein [Dyella acidiphila]|uniref:ATP-binding protein n=1 Tax=Dyella acidiphila TaxID=2775866 RepID=A0ABR9GE31_9GAMM|nr:ATP-binding protein [Dyella acidiphila]MBE1162302.1 ATP-binding protein [Dyella acidiphila]
MVIAADWIPAALEALKTTKVLHRNYEFARKQLTGAHHAVMKGDLIVQVGPSRVGKTRCVKDAFNVHEPNWPSDDQRMPVVIVEASNDSKNGEFSTKAFMAACLRAIHHPIYGISDEDDPWEERLQAKIHRTPEGTLRSAFETAIALRRTELIVFDEAHHVRYAPGGDAAAARILDSYKCLANRTNIKLVLTGSYQLLDLLVLAPHLLGRQIPLEFPRYHADVRNDVAAWQQVLRTYSKHLAFDNDESLSDWGDYLFEGSQGCVGQLLSWLKAALTVLLTTNGVVMTRDVLERTRKPAAQEASILAEIVKGELQLVRVKRASAQCETHTEDGGARKASNEKEIKRKEQARKPFQRKSRRNPLGGRT